MPPCAAPRMNSPFLRMARAAIRPLTASKAPSLRATWTIGFGPMPLHGPLKTDGPGAGACLRLLAVSAAAERSAPACATPSGESPAVRLAMYWASSASSLAPFSSLTWPAIDCAPGARVGVSIVFSGVGGLAMPGPAAAAANTSEMTRALSGRNPRFPIFFLSVTADGDHREQSRELPRDKRRPTPDRAVSTATSASPNTVPTPGSESQANTCMNIPALNPSAALHTKGFTVRLVDAKSRRQPAGPDLRALDDEVDPLAGEVQPMHLDAVPQPGRHRRDAKRLALRLRLEAEDRRNAREHRRRRPQLRDAGVPVLRRRGARLSDVTAEKLGRSAQRKMERRLDQGASHALRFFGEAVLP